MFFFPRLPSVARVHMTFVATTAGYIVHRPFSDNSRIAEHEARAGLVLWLAYSRRLMHAAQACYFYHPRLEYKFLLGRVFPQT